MCEIVLRHFCHTQNLAREYLSVIIVFSYSHFVSSIACVRVRTMLYCTVHNVIVSGIECDLLVERARNRHRSGFDREWQANYGNEAKRNSRDNGSRGIQNVSTLRACHTIAGQALDGFAPGYAHDRPQAVLRADLGGGRTFRPRTERSAA